MPTPPTYHETNPADAPILVLGLTSNMLPITTVDDYAESILAQKLSQVPGVGLVSIGGEQHPAIRMQFDPAQLAADGLDLEDVRNALTNVSVDQPKGSLYGPARRLYAADQRPDLVAAGMEQPDHRLSQWRADHGCAMSARPSSGRRTSRSRAGSTGTAASSCAIQRLPGANVIATVQAVKAALPQIEASLPPTIKISVISDRTTTHPCLGRRRRSSR